MLLSRIFFLKNWVSFLKYVFKGTFFALLFVYCFPPPSYKIHAFIKKEKEGKKESSEIYKKK